MLGNNHNCMKITVIKLLTTTSRVRSIRNNTTPYLDYHFKFSKIQFYRGLIKIDIFFLNRRKCVLLLVFVLEII